MSDGLVSVEVVGDLPIVDAVSGLDVVTGGTVRLDPAVTRVDLLVAAGLVREVPARARRSSGDQTDAV